MFNYVTQLRWVLTDPDLAKLDDHNLVDDAARQAALAVATALGHCRIAGQKLPSEMDGTLDASLTLRATERACWLAKQLTSQFEQLRLHPEAAADDPFYDLDNRCSILLARHDLWAASTAIEEAHTRLNSKDGLPPVAEILDRFVEFASAECELDAHLIPHADEFSGVLDLPLLDNLRADIDSNADVSNLPWWLDGTIEKAAATALQRFIASMPAPAAMRKAVAARKTPIPDPGAPPIEKMEEFAERVTAAFRQRFIDEEMLAIAASSDVRKETEVLWDSKQDLALLRCIVYRERDGDLRLAWSSTDATLKDQTFEVVVQEQTRPTITFRHDPQTGGVFAETRIRRDELPGAGLSQFTFRLKRS